MSGGRLPAFLLAAALALPACLLPQEDHIIQPLPPLLNQPPRILENLLQPASRFFTAAWMTSCSGNCPVSSFE